MRKVKVLLSVFAALIAAFAFAPTAMADGDGTITIDNSLTGETYSFYKVFDASYDGSNVSYTYDGSNATFLAALQNEASPFSCVGPVSGKYTIAKKASVTDEAVIIDFIKNNAANLGNAVKTLAGNNDTRIQAELPYGYYYITTANGTAVTITSAVPNVTVADKNQVTTIDKQESVDGGTTWVYPNKFDNTNVPPTASVGDSVQYKITGDFTRYIGGDKVEYYTFTDELSGGLAPNQDVVIKVNNVVVYDYQNTTAPTTATVTYDGLKTTIRVDMLNADGGFLYPSVVPYEVTYSALITADAISHQEALDNDVKLKFNGDSFVASVTGSSDKVRVRNYNIFLTKVDANDANKKLSGAKFKLYTAKIGGEQIKVVLVTGDDKGDGTADSTKNNVYRVAVTDAEKTAGTDLEMITSKTGIIEVKGLANGNYYFEETAAPSGYNLLTERTNAVTIDNTDPEFSQARITVENGTGTLLPSTGGMGTTAFYIIGLLLVVGVAVRIIVKRRS